MSGSSWGRSAFLQRDSILPGVSLPSSVVRSVIDTAVLRPQTFAVFFMLRVANFATRSSTPTWSTEPTSSRRREWAVWEARGIAGQLLRNPCKTIEKRHGRRPSYPSDHPGGTPAAKIAKGQEAPRRGGPVRGGGGEDRLRADRRRPPVREDLRNRCLGGREDP